MQSIENLCAQVAVIFIFLRNEVDFWVLTGGTLIGLTKKSKNFEKNFFSQKLIFYDLQCIKRYFIEKKFFGL